MTAAARYNDVDALGSVGLKRLGDVAGCDVRFDEPMAPHTTYKVGGPAAAFVEVDTREGLAEVLNLLAELGLPYLVLGNGSNVLFADAGYHGAVLHLSHGFSGISLARDAYAPGVHRLRAGAGASITRLLRVAKETRIAGVEALGGVPGTVGGAVRMNAGTVLGEVKDALEAAEVVAPGQSPRWIPAADLGLAYRHSDLPDGGIVTAARFRCTDADEAMRARLDEVLAYRKRTQPLTMPSCGSVFANPPGDHAGRLIEASGLKGRRVGGAQISEQHANWIVNTGGATGPRAAAKTTASTTAPTTAKDIRDLIELCVDTVRRDHGVTLRHEVKLLGDWP